MSDISRRQFLAKVGIGAAAGTALLAGRAHVLPAKETRKVRRGTDVVTLGRTGLKPTLLGLGTGTVSGSQQRNMGQEAFTKFVRYALDRGIRYIDTADSYKTHPFVRKALEGVPRERFFLQTKTFNRKPDGVRADIERFRRELNVETLDTLLMHCMSSAKWPTEMRPVMDVLEDAKKQGWIRAYGISNHGWAPLAASAETDWPDLQLVRINPFNVAMDAEPEKVAGLLKKVHEKGRGVIGMKIYGETGLGSREKRLESLKYVLGLGCVDCFTIGFTSIQQLDETLELIEQATG